MDLLLILVMVGVVWFLTWFAYRVGEDKAARIYQSELASTRAKLRRVTHDLDNAYEIARIRREHRGGGA